MFESEIMLPCCTETTMWTHMLNIDGEILNLCNHIFPLCESWHCGFSDFCISVLFLIKERFSQVIWEVILNYIQERAFHCNAQRLIHLTAFNRHLDVFVFFYLEAMFSWQQGFVNSSLSLSSTELAWKRSVTNSKNTPNMRTLSGSRWIQKILGKLCAKMDCCPQRQQTNWKRVKSKWAKLWRTILRQQVSLLNICNG